MKKIIAFFCVAAIAYAVFAATDLTITISLSPAQSRGLQLATDAYNANLTANDSKAATVSQSQFAALKLTEALDAFAKRAADADNAALVLKYQNLKAADRATVDSVLK